MSELNYAYAVFDGKCNFAVTNLLWQYNYGQLLSISGIDLPDTFEVQFGQKGGATTKTQIYSDGSVAIPDEFLLSGEWIEAYVYLHATNEDGETCYKISIPVSPRQQPTNQEPTPVQQDVITETIAALNAAVSEVEDMAITPEEREKLAGIEAGAEVNDIDRIEYWAGAGWSPLPIENKTVRLPIVDIPEQVFYPEFTVEDSGDDLVVTEASHTASQIVNTASFGTYSITAKVALDGTTYYLPMCEASDDVIPWRCAFAGEIRDGAFLRIYDVGLEWRVSIYEGVAYDTYTDAMQGIDEALDEIVSVPDGGTAGQVLSRTADDGLAWVNQSGGGGGTSDYTDLSNKPQINGHTLSGNKTASDLGLAPAGAYVKPSGGIPKTDLASGVQASLEKADSAYQKPSGGIPASDLASGVIPTVPVASDSTPQALGTAAAGSSASFSRADHVHAKPTASDIGAVAVAQGVAHAGEFVVVGSDGNITTVTMSVWQGGSY